MEFFGDYHTHTTYSDGHGSIKENVQAAVNKGLEVIGIADHGPRNIGTGVDSAKTYLKIKEEAGEINKEYDNIQVLVGAEADITSITGHIDVPEDVAKKLDFLIVGLHPYVLPDSFSDGWELIIKNQLVKLSPSMQEKVINTNTKALVEAMDKNPVDIISHPDLGMHVDLKELARACNKYDVAVEINTGHQYDKTKLVLDTLGEGVNYIVNSDAHFPETIGNLQDGLHLLERARVPVERILNARQGN